MQTMSLIQFCPASHAVLNQECLVLKFPIQLGAWPLSSVGIPNSGADPGFFLGGGALISCSTSTPINHIVFFWQNTSCIRKPQVISGKGGGECAHPRHPPPRSAPVIGMVYLVPVGVLTLCEQSFLLFSWSRRKEGGSVLKELSHEIQPN